MLNPFSVGIFIILFLASISYVSTYTAIPYKRNFLLSSKKTSQPVSSNASKSKISASKDPISSTVMEGVGSEGCKLPSPSGINMLPTSYQATTFFSLFGLLFAVTYEIVQFLMWIETLPILSSLFSSYQSTWAPTFGIVFMLAGIAHFKVKEEFKNIYPYPGAWGLWYLPGSAEFHVVWTGVAEFLGGLWLFLSSISYLLPSSLSPYLSQSTASFLLLLLTVAVTPANIFMFTHGAKLPISGPPVSWKFHAIRGFIQSLLFALLYILSLPTIEMIGK